MATPLLFKNNFFGQKRSHLFFLLHFATMRAQ